MNGAALRFWACLAAFVATDLAAQTPVPTPMPTPWAVIAPEFPINTTTLEDQHSPDIAFGANDGFVVVWTSHQQDGSGDGIVARRFDAAGQPISGEFQINSYTTGNQYDPKIASDVPGNFVVVWSTRPNAAGGTDVMARRYDPAGNALGPEFMVNFFTTGNQTDADVAMNRAGFTVAWTSLPNGAEPPQDGDGAGVFAQWFDANGERITLEDVQLNTFTTGSQSDPSVAMNASLYAHEFVVVWSSDGQDADMGGVFGRHSTVVDEFPVNLYTTGDQAQPDVAANANGGFVVTWSSSSQDGSGDGVFGRLIHASLGPHFDFQINTYTTGAQQRPAVATMPDNGLGTNFVVAWEGAGQDDPASPSNTGVFAQRFNNAPFPTSTFWLAAPPRRGSEYQVNTHTQDIQRRPAVSMSQRGQFVIVWESAEQDGSGLGIFGRRGGFPDAGAAGFGVPMMVDQRPSGGASNVNGVLEAGERVTVDPAWHNPTFFDLPLSGILSNIAGPSGPMYSIDDSSGDYGTIDLLQFIDCFSATGNCYEISLTGARPAPHWDATVDETPASSGPLGPVTQLTKTWALHVGGSFADVPPDAFYPFIENIFHNRVTMGGGCGAGLYCGEESVLRQQMAVFLLKGVYGADFVPGPATGALFDDVSASSPFAPWIEELARQQVTGGCTAPPPPVLPSYCPASPVNRQQMAVFLTRMYIGNQIIPTDCTGVFDDVPCSNPFAPWVEYLVASGTTAGCSASPPLYCPTDPVKRKQMAAFLVKTFGLELYGAD